MTTKTTKAKKKSETVEGEAVSPCAGVSDRECAKRPGCRMPDGSWCPRYGAPKWGTRA